MLELLFVEALVVRLFGADPFHSQVLHDRVVQRLIAEFLADLNHAGNLMRLAFAHKVGYGRGEHQNLHRGHAAFLVNAPEQALGHDAFEGFRERGANLVLLLRGKDVDHAVHGFGGALGVQRAEHQVAGAGRGQGQFYRLQVAHFAHQDDVRVFAQGAAQGGRKRLGVNADFPVVHEAVFALMHELDRIFDRDDVIAAVLVAVIDHGRQRRGFA